MPDPSSVTKVSLPRLRHVLVPRKRILRRLSEGIQHGHLLTLVATPAGYGKTTTIRMWVKEAEYPVARVTLEKSDSEPKQFLTYVLAALQQVEDLLG